MQSLYIIVELEAAEVTQSYYGGHVEVVTAWGEELPRPMWTMDKDMAATFTDRDEAKRLAEDFQSYAASKGWPIHYRAELRGF